MTNLNTYLNTNVKFAEANCDNSMSLGSSHIFTFDKQGLDVVITSNSLYLYDGQTKTVLLSWPKYYTVGHTIVSKYTVEISIRKEVK